MQTVRTAIILAGGSGLRAGGPMPKQLHLLGGVPVFIHSIKRFLEADPDTHIILVIHPDYEPLFLQYTEEYGIDATVVFGGDSRIASVANALKHLPDSDGHPHLVAVHDAARPLVTSDMIQRGWNLAREAFAAVPVVDLSDSIRKLTDGGSQTVDRSLYKAVQTPQIFLADFLTRAYDFAMSLDESRRATLTDDASVVEAAGLVSDMPLYKGNSTNFKITGPADFAVAEALLNYEQSLLN